MTVVLGFGVACFEEGLTRGGLMVQERGACGPWSRTLLERTGFTSVT